MRPAQHFGSIGRLADMADCGVWAKHERDLCKGADESSFLPHQELLIVCADSRVPYLFRFCIKRAVLRSLRECYDCIPLAKMDYHPANGLVKSPAPETRHC